MADCNPADGSGQVGVIDGAQQPHARADMPRLLDAVEALTAENANLKATIADPQVARWIDAAEALRLECGWLCQQAIWGVEKAKEALGALAESRATIDSLKAENAALRACLEISEDNQAVGGGYNAYRREVEAAHAAAVAVARGS